MIIVSQIENFLSESQCEEIIKKFNNLRTRYSLVTWLKLNQIEDRER